MVVHLLCRRGVVASVTPYRLFGADKGPYVTTEDFFPIASPPPIYKVTDLHDHLCPAEFPIPYLKYQAKLRMLDLQAFSNHRIFFSSFSQLLIS